MANFSANQVRQFYVVLSKADSFDDTLSSGAAMVKKTIDDTIYLHYVTPNGNDGPLVTTTDKFPLKNIVSAIASPATSRKLKRVSLSFDPTINGGNPIAGQLYAISATFYGLGVGGSANQYTKMLGSYRAKEGDTSTIVMAALNKEANANLKSEPVQYATATDPKDGTLVIEEKPQPWVLGKKQASPINFNVQPIPIELKTSSGSYGGTYPWAVVSDITSTNTNVVKNGKEVADMEWFYTGFRADSIRGYNYPDNFETKYLVDPSKEYDAIDIKYFYVGDNEDSDRSNKYLTLVVPRDGAYPIKTLVEDLEKVGVQVKSYL